MEAFRVLPPLGAQPPPPPPSPSPRVAPRFVQQKESSAFVVLAEVGTGPQPSGRASPFRGRGFRPPPVSKIPVKSAPTSPGPRAPKPAVGKSAPTSPSRPVPAKRVVTVKQPSSPRKAVTRPPPKPRVQQKVTTKDEQPKGTLKKAADIENRALKKQNDGGDRVSNNKKQNGAGDEVTKKSNEMEVRRVRPLNRNNSVANDGVEKTNATIGTGVSGPAPRTGRAALERTAVIMDRVNRLRPDKQMINSTRPVKRNSVRNKNEVTESNTKTEKNTENKLTGEEQQKSKSKILPIENTNTQPPLPESTDHKNTRTEVKDLPTSNKTFHPNNEALGTNTTLVTTDNKTTLTVNEDKQTKVPGSIEMKSTEKMESPGNSNTIILTKNSTTLKPAESNSNITTSTSMDFATSLTGNSSTLGDNEDSSSASPSSSQLMLVTGTTKVNVEPLKEGLNFIDKTARTNDINRINKGEEQTINNKIVDDFTVNTGGEGVIVGIMHNGVSNSKANGNEVIPNGDISGKTGVISMPNGGETLRNKIIIHQSDKNGTVKVIGSEPVNSGIEEVIKESIVTETVVPSEEVLLRKEVQPDLIPSSQEVEEAPVTVVGQPDIEVEAANHTVTFRYPRGHGSMETGLRPPPERAEIRNGDGKISPEIHPVSARKNKQRNFRELCSCCRSASMSQGCSWRLPWFKKRNGPGPPMPPKVRKKRPSLSSLFSCCKCKGIKRETKPPQAHKPPESSTEIVPKSQEKTENLCRRIFCFCCKKKNSSLEPPPGPKKRSYLQKLLCCCCSGRKSTVRPRPQQSQELLKNRRKEMSKSRTTSIQSGFSKLEHSLVEHSSMMRAAIPVLPICLAWTCLILNVFLPGTGTMTSGILCLCFGKPRFSVNDTAIARLGAFCVNLVIGFGQIFTIIFCLVGWGWSIWWGVIMLRLARKHRRIKIAEKNASQPPSVNQNHDFERGH